MRQSEPRVRGPLDFNVERKYEKRIPIPEHSNYRAYTVHRGTNLGSYRRVSCPSEIRTNDLGEHRDIISSGEWLRYDGNVPGKQERPLVLLYRCSYDFCSLIWHVAFPENPIGRT